MTYKPSGYTDMSPYLLVSDIEVVLSFCEAVFGATRLRIHRAAAGGRHAECRIGDSVLMMGEADGPTAMLHLYVTDPDAVFERALAHGATVIAPIRDTPEGDRRGGFSGPDGTQWYVARQIADA